MDNQSFAMEGSKGSYLQHQLEQEDGPDDLTDDQIERLLKNAELRLEHHTAQSSEAAIFSESVTSRPPYKFDIQNLSCHPID